MALRSDPPVTQLLAEWRGGDQAALEKLTAVLYNELRRLAQQQLARERPGHTLQPTALVHEAFVQLMGQRSADWRNRGHFFALAARLMRRILVDHARARLATKRGGGAAVFSLDELTQPSDGEDPGATGECGTLSEPGQEDHRADADVSALDQALTRLATIDKRQAQIVEMRYFGGLSIRETAQSLELSDATVKREWALARAWLQREVSRYA
jgi:RNA polymerase sigma-70 factor, ECF subfamily